VLATGHHYVLDIVGGVTLLAVAAWLSRLISTRQPQPDS
jgi:hypothetical protein